MEAYCQNDHTAILSCLTEDVEWFVPGAFRVNGKAAFDKEIEGECFVGPPQISVTRLTEENDVVIAEGTVLTETKAGEKINLVFCDVFEMQQGKIKKLISYLVTL